MDLRFKRDRRGVSSIIVVVLSLVIVVVIISNIVLWSYELNQLDWEKMKEEINIINVERDIETNGTRFNFKNEGALTSHLVSLWIINSTTHQRYDIEVIINSAETKNYLRADISLPDNQFTVKVTTERGNIAVLSG
jgi:hypothetical protein